MKTNLEVEILILKYFNKEKITKKLIVEYIEMLLDNNQNANKFINYYENKYKEKY